MTTRRQDFQAPVQYDPPDVVLARLGFNDDASRAFVYAEAAIMKVDSGLLDIPENIAEVVKAAQYTRDYGFMPGIHLHMQGPFNTEVMRKLPNGTSVKVSEKRMALVVGEQAYKAAARIQANKEGDHLEFEWEPLTEEAIAAYVEENMPKPFDLTKEDRGVRARVLSYKGAQIAISMGRKYDPEWSYGFCFVKGHRKEGQNGPYYPKSDRDRIPSQRVALDVAMRRAIKAAIMQKYHLVPLGEGTPEQRISQVMRTAAPDARNGWMHARDADSHAAVEDDGDVLFYGEHSNRDTVIDVKFSSTSTPSVSAPPPPDILNDAAVAEPVKAFVRQVRGAERPGARTATEKQYQYAIAVVEAITGKDTHGAVFSALWGREVDRQNPAAEAGLQVLFKHLCKTRREKQGNEWVTVDNSDYDPDVVQMLGEVGKWASLQDKRVAQ